MKKILIAISCVVLAMTMCVTLVSCSNAGKEIDVTTTTHENAENEQNQASDDNGGTTAKPEQGEKDSNGKDKTTEVVTDKDGKPVTTKAGQTTTKQTTTKKKKTTTTTTQEYYMTTTDKSGAIITPEESFDDDYPYTSTEIMAYMETRYDNEKYVINIVEEDIQSAKLVVFNKKDGTIYSIAKASLKTGKINETVKKTGKKIAYKVYD